MASLRESVLKPRPERPLLMHPIVFLGAWLALGGLFALQEYVGMRSWGYQGHFATDLAAWIVHFFFWGLICQVMWQRFRDTIQRANLTYILTRIAPVSLLLSVLEEALWVACFPSLPLGHRHWGYFRRLEFYLDSELIDNLVIFWVNFFLFRGIEYYQRYRQEEYAAVRLEAELTAAQLRALRMQLNPHFLFNTLNNISSLIHSDPEGADQMLERMSSMFRMTLDRGDAQTIPLGDEIDFVQLYLSIQQQRFPETVHHYIAVSPEVRDALVPTMILQPIVENAYVHGVSKTAGHAFVGIEAQSHGGQLRICVRNSGRGLGPGHPSNKERERVGIPNVKARLNLQYGASHQFTLEEVSDGEVQAILLLPLSYPAGLNGA
jgi:two-component system LytT family sensor kinase